MASYAISAQDTNTANTTMVALTGGTGVHPVIYDWMIHPDSAPTDTHVSYALQRYTAAGTSTSVTPQPLKTPSPAATSTAGRAHSVEPTYTANAYLAMMGGYSRAMLRWQTDPEYGLGVPPTASNGIGCLVLAVGTAQSVQTTIHFRE